MKKVEVSDDESMYLTVLLTQELMRAYHEAQTSDKKDKHKEFTLISNILNKFRNT